MTLTELRYVVALERERHFGRAADSCFVSQPTLSIAIKKLEEELGTTLFERDTNEIRVTPVGQQMVEQAKRVLHEMAQFSEIAQHGKNELASPLRLGVIYTIGPYLLPQLIPAIHGLAADMPLIIEENFTSRLTEKLKLGELDAIIVSLPFAEPNISTIDLYDEPFMVVLPPHHPWKSLKRIPVSRLLEEDVLLLGAGNCFREQVMQVCPNINSAKLINQTALQKTLEGSSLETIRHMVATNVGITVLPCSAVFRPGADNSLLIARPFEPPVPQRRVVLAYRKSFYRPQAISALQQAVADCMVEGVVKL